MTNPSHHTKHDRVTGGPSLPVLKSVLRSRHGERLNPLLVGLPEGVSLCARCGGHINIADQVGNLVSCPKGHVYDVEVDSRGWNGGKGGWTHGGLTLAQFGRVCEDAVFSLPDLRGYGNPEPFPEYHSPLDGITDRGFMVEVKGVSWVARKRRFGTPDKKTLAKRHAFAKHHEARGICCVLAELYLPQPEVRCWVRQGPQLITFEPVGEPDFVVKIDDPFAEPPSPEIPF